MYAQVINILAIEVNYTCIDQETLLKDVNLDDIRQLFFVYLVSSELFLQRLFHETATKFVDGLSVPLHDLVVEYLVLWTLHYSLVVQILKKIRQHSFDKLPDLDTLVSEIFLFFLVVIAVWHLNIVRETGKEACGRIKSNFVLQVVNPVLQGHRLTDGCLKIHVGAGCHCVRVILLIKEHGRLVWYTRLRERLHIQLFAQRHFVKRLCEL